MALSHDQLLDLLRRVARPVPGAMALARWLHRRIDPGLRAIAKAERVFAGELFQPWPTTETNRYPALFDALAERLARLPAPRVLSFGCASGEEMRALRDRLPLAQLTGIDANARAIAAARAADPSPLSRYRHAARPDPGETFDAVLAMAVFRHGQLSADQAGDCSALLPFARFEAGVAMLDACLEPGGYLMIGNAQLRFCDTRIARRYAVEPQRLAPVPGDPRYGCDNRRLSDETYDEVLFRKLAG